MAAVRGAGRWYNAVWRWHFYAGLFCLPFVLWLAVTGTIYLWKPQIEAAIERPYDHLPVAGARANPDRIAAVALAAVPGATLHKYVLPRTPEQAVRVIVGAGGVETRVYVDPYRGRVLARESEAARPMATVSRLHGTLLAGNPGSWLVEIAACWAITLLLTGLYLWWPRGRSGQGLGGILWPRWRSGRRIFWRDTHAVAGIWVSVAALALIATGLPWANGWGNYLKAVRAATGTADGPVDWSTGASRAMLGDHAEHGGMTMAHRGPAPGELDRVVAAAMPLGLAGPVLVAPPKPGKDAWTATSDAADRPLRGSATIDGATGRVLSQKGFAQKHVIDRAIGYGIAWHEGALFGLANQLLNTAITLLLATLSVSGTVLWWRRRRAGTLGAPPALVRPRYGVALVTAIGALGVAMPLFGTTLILALLAERLVPRGSTAGRWLGLRPA